MKPHFSWLKSLKVNGEIKINDLTKLLSIENNKMLFNFFFFSEYI